MFHYWMERFKTDDLMFMNLKQNWCQNNANINDNILSRII